MKKARTQRLLTDDVTLQAVRGRALRLGAHKSGGPTTKGLPPQRPGQWALHSIVDNRRGWFGTAVRRVVDLAQRLRDEFQAMISEQVVSREQYATGYGKLPAQLQRHAQAAA